MNFNLLIISLLLLWHGNEEVGEVQCPPGEPRGQRLSPALGGSMLLLGKPGYLEEYRSCIPAKNNSLMARE